MAVIAFAAEADGAVEQLFAKACALRLGCHDEPAEVGAAVLGIVAVDHDRTEKPVVRPQGRQQQIPIGLHVDEEVSEVGRDLGLESEAERPGLRVIARVGADDI